MSDSHAPEGYGTVTPYLLHSDLETLIEFLEKGLGGTCTEKVASPDGKVRHAEVRIGDSMVMMGSSTSDHPAYSPAMHYVYVGDCDAAFQQAIDAGATSYQEPALQFYGDKTAGVIGPCGNYWYLSQRVEDLSPEEIQRRAAEMMKGS